MTNTAARAGLGRRPDGQRTRARLSVRVLALLLVAGAPVVVTSAPAQADTPGCAAHDEFRRVEKGMRKHRVHEILDTRGRFGDGGAGGYSRLYRHCFHRPGTPDCDAVIEYVVTRRGVARVSTKAWSGFCSSGAA